ncbi:MAG: DUF4156 domain-containing protein [Halieaceae bacterium]|nr:DUF4156 domain-containing protein [Halieaceae bacterium]
MRLLALCLAVSLLPACTWVKLSPEGESVTVVASVPSSCKRLGSTTSSTKADLASIDRSSKKVATELQTLARNSAAKMGGDTISAESEVSENGEQTFGIYRCGA